MDFQRGERVTLNFDTGGVEKLEQEESHEHFTPTFPTFVSDILERESSTAPVAPSLNGNKAGFPAHKKRIPRVSAFKQQRAAKEQQAAAAQKAQDAPKPRAGFDPKDEKQAIDKENRERLDAMSDAEIEEERQELLQGLSPALIQKLLMRSNIDDGSNERDLYPETVPAPSHAADEVEVVEKPESKPNPPASTKTVSFVSPEIETEPPTAPQETQPSPQPQHSQASSTSPSTTTTSIQQDPHPTEDSIHFPHPPQPPDLDPNDPSFLTHLHTKYFPNLPYNPTSLSWMTPIDPSDVTSAYHPSHSALAASDLRFDFNGALLAPSVARQIPTDRGLHHHADAPEAAGYTVPELAVLARSQVAAQRCMAYQTLGRVLYRLGRGEFGVERARQETDGPVQVAVNHGEDEEGDEEEDEDVDVGSAMAGGLWACVEEGRVIETMTEEAGRERGHLTARTFAQEALWNWRRGGGRKRHAV